jgi:NAD kinase
MLLPYNRDPETGSLIPSISAGGAAIKPTIKAIVATPIKGNIKIPNHPMKILFEVDKTTPTKDPHQLYLE